MSYILDALRRADSERERASIPSIHAQPVPHASPGARGLAAPRPWVWMVAGVLAVLLGQGLWQWLRDPATEGSPHQAAGGPADTPAAPIPAPAAADATVAGPQTARPPEPVPAPAAAADATPSAEPPPTVVLQIPPQAGPAPSGRAANAPPRGAAGSAAAATPAAVARKAAPQPRPSVPPPTQPPAAPPEQAAPQEAPIYALAALPTNVRQALPPLQVGGSVYSEDPGSRFVILNGLIFHENDKPAADLLLERIELKSAVLSFRGYRFRISF